MMYEKVILYRMRCLSPAHPGVGSGITGVADLPIQREARTNWPKIEASSLKGALRSAFRKCKDKDKGSTEMIFGSEAPTNDNENKETKPGAIGLSDARILLFPARSLRGGWVHLVSPSVIKELRDMLEAVKPGFDLGLDVGLEKWPGETQAIVPENSKALYNNTLYIEEFRLNAVSNPGLSSLASALGTDRLSLVEDDFFNEFVSHYTEIVPRIKIKTDDAKHDDAKDDNVKKMDEKQALWYEERIPQESVFYFFAFFRGGQAEQAMAKLRNYLKEHPYLQVGGNYTLGEGIVKIEEWSNENAGQ